ncbi:hypothetical protein, partial [Chloroflexus sp.]|uniref:hypothetical protein n=1 Tax=Chloroflexus sp. TaxID=1904827 RepID=UPI002ADD5FC8
MTAHWPSEAFAYPLTALVDDIFPEADVIWVVLDNLNPIRQRLYTRPFRRRKPSGLPAGWRFIPR